MDNGRTGAKAPSDEAPLARMAGLMGEAMEAAVAGQALGLALLRAEMEAIAALMPGLPAEAGTAPAAEARERAEAARIETDLDNLPV